MRLCLGALLAKLRQIQQANPDDELVALPRDVLKTLAVPLSRTGMCVDAQGVEVANYIALRDRAREIGVLGPVAIHFSKTKKRANVFLLPPPRLSRGEFDAIIERARAASAMLKARTAA